MKRDDFDLVVLDLDGTLYSSGEPIAGAAEAVAAIRKAGLALRFATNTFATAPEGILKRLADSGFAAEPEELVTPRNVLEALVRQRPGIRMYPFLSPRIAATLPFLPPVAETRPGCVLLGDADELWTYDAIGFSSWATSPRSTWPSPRR